MTIYKLSIVPQSTKLYADRTPEESPRILEEPFMTTEAADQKALEVAYQYADQHSLPRHHVMQFEGGVVRVFSVENPPKPVLLIQRVSIGASAEEIASLKLDA